jgi:hypothetical protein
MKFFCLFLILLLKFSNSFAAVVFNGVFDDDQYKERSKKNPLQNFRLDKYFGLFEGYAETLRGNCSDFRQIDQY